MSVREQGPLAGIRVLEVAGIGPAPFCGMLLADLGADVVVIQRVDGSAGSMADLDRRAIFNRGKRSVGIDLKTPAGIATTLGLIGRCDALIEGMRPSVMERLGLSPETCLKRNPKLVYGRVTGWGQHGPLAQAAGHDVNYIALSGALWYAGVPDEPPLTPPSLVGDIGGGALYLAIGILAGIMNARGTGRGQVVDAAIVDGSAHMMSLLLGLRALGRLSPARGQSVLDGSHRYGTYRCADGHWISLGTVEPKFYRELRERLGLATDSVFDDPDNQDNWPELRRRFAELFASRDRDEWCALLEGTDACFAPVLSPDQAADHPHMRARAVYTRNDGLLQANPAPRFSGTPAGVPGPVPVRGEHTELVLREWGVNSAG